MTFNIRLYLSIFIQIQMKELQQAYVYKLLIVIMVKYQILNFQTLEPESPWNPGGPT